MPVRARRRVVAHLGRGRQREADEERDEEEIGGSRDPAHAPDRRTRHLIAT
jgi:hypothetical protein